MGPCKCHNNGLHRRKLILRIIFDIVCILLVSAGIFAINLGSKPYHRGFFCDDESIKHPVLPDTITVTTAACVGFLIPFFMIVFIEFLLRNGSIGVFISWKGYKLRHVSWLLSSYNTISVFIFGMAVNQFLTEVGKNSIGRLRPHFLTLCKPDYSKFNCSDGYITADVCTSTDTDMMAEARLSFPSGHSSFTAYCALYLILYLEVRISCELIILLKPVVQLIVFSLAFYTCLSRISDYKHHWSDVLCGAILGIGVSIVVVIALTDFGRFLCKRSSIYFQDDKDLRNEETAQESALQTGSNAINYTN